MRDPTNRFSNGVWAPQTTMLEDVVPVAGARWTIESRFEAATGEVGLEHYEVQSWMGWYRHITLAMWAYALLTVLRAAHVPAVALQKRGAGPSALPSGVQGGAGPAVPLSVPEMRRLFWPLVLAVQQRVERILAWSRWRRAHQGRGHILAR